jgi:hypothetical protein
MGRSGGGRWGLFLVLAALVLGAGGVTVLARVLAWPSQPEPAQPPPDAGTRVEGVLAQLLLREAGLSTRQDPLVLGAEEVNAFLARQVQVRDSPVWPVRVQIYPAEVELGGPTTLGRLAEASIGERLGRLLPGTIAERSVWVATRGTVVLMSDGTAEFAAHAATIGRQGIPLALFWRVVGGRPRALVWRMPRVVEQVEIQPGRLVIHTRRPGTGRGHSGPGGGGPSGPRAVPG